MERQETTLIVVATIVGFVTGMILLACLFVIWHYCVRVPRKKVSPKKERYVPITDPNPSFDLIRIQEPPTTLEIYHDQQPSQPFHFDVSPTPSPAMTPNRPGEICICDQKYTPAKKDDVELELGDQTFTDGWCHGLNMTRNTKGMFPIHCVKLADDGQVITSPETDFDLPPKAEPGHGKLLYSMLYVLLIRPPEEAMEIVNELDPETRTQYFESSLQSNPLRKKASKEQKGRAEFNWSILRTSWRDAVKAELQSSYDDWAAKRNRNAFWKLMVDNYRID